MHLAALQTLAITAADMEGGPDSAPTGGGVEGVDKALEAGRCRVLLLGFLCLLLHLNLHAPAQLHISLCCALSCTCSGPGMI